MGVYVYIRTKEAKMKVVAFVALCLVAAVSAKKHPIKIKQTCHNPMVTVSNVFAEGGGTVDKHSVLHLDVYSDMDTTRLDPFDQLLTIKLYKWVIVGYVKVPDPVMRIVCHKVEKVRPGKVTCLKDGIVLVHCMLDEVTGHCLPKKGRSSLTIHMIPTLIQNALQHESPNWIGKMKVNVVATSPAVHGELFCNELEMYVKIA